MFAYWEPGTQYNHGDVVEYEGDRYKIIQPHLAQGDWTPPATPALWGRIPREEWQHGEHQGRQQEQQSGWGQQQQRPQQPQGGGSYHNSDVKPPPDYSSHPDQTVEIDHEEQKKNWWDLDEKRKHELKVGGGLLAGAAALAGGIYAYREHKKGDKEISSEEEDALTWSLQGWLREAHARTEEFRKHGPKGPTTWVLTEGQHIPKGALQGGRDAHGNPIYISRAFVEGGLQVGKASSLFKKGAAIGFMYKEYELPTYEILLGDPSAVHWVPVVGPFNPNGVRPVEAGHEDNGAKLYIAQATFHGGLHPGKCASHLAGAYVAFGGEEHEVKEYNVLVYN